MVKQENVILVDQEDKVLGIMEKMEAHRKGLLHRAFSIYLFNSKGQILLQKRAGSKYHSGGLWTNTCCSHPRPEESIEDAARRRLKEEMGIETQLNEICSFTYKVELDKGMTEHELLHVFTGSYEKEPQINPEEAEGWGYFDVPFILKDMHNNPDKYTEWFRITIPLIFDKNGNLNM